MICSSTATLNIKVDGIILLKGFEDKWRMTNNSLPSQIGGIAIATLLFAIALFWFSSRRKAPSSSAAATQTTLSKKSVGGDETEASDGNVTTKHDEDAGNNSSSSKLRNVFSVKQKPIFGNSRDKTKGSSSTDNSRPFESSYYFAHNKHSTGCVCLLFCFQP